MAKCTVLPPTALPLLLEPSCSGFSPSTIRSSVQYSFVCSDFVGGEILQRPEPGAGVQADDREALFGQPAGQRAAAGAGADDQEIHRLDRAVLRASAPSRRARRTSGARPALPRGSARGSSDMTVLPARRVSDHRAPPPPPTGRARRSPCGHSRAGWPGRPSRSRSRRWGATSRRATMSPSSRCLKNVLDGISPQARCFSSPCSICFSNACCWAAERSRKDCWCAASASLFRPAGRAARPAGRAAIPGSGSRPGRPRAASCRSGRRPVSAAGASAAARCWAAIASTCANSDSEKNRGVRGTASRRSTTCRVFSFQEGVLRFASTS